MFSPISALKSRTTIILSYCDKNKSKLLLIVCRWLLLLSVCENIELQDWSLILAFSFYQGYQKLQSPIARKIYTGRLFLVYTLFL